MDEYLQRMGELYECVLFTASLSKVSYCCGTLYPGSLEPRGLEAALDSTAAAYLNSSAGLVPSRIQFISFIL